MEITRHLDYRVNLGNYEHLDIGAALTVRDGDIPCDSNWSPARLVEVLDRFATSQLETMLAADLKAAGELTTSKDSFAKIESPPAPHIQPSTRPRKRN